MTQAIRHEAELRQKMTDQLDPTLERKIRELIRTSSERPSAGAELCALGDEAIRILISLTEAEARQRRKLIKVLSIMHLCTYAVLLLCLPLPGLRKLEFLLPVMLLLGVPIFGRLIASLQAWKATRLLAKIDSVQAIGALLDVRTIVSNSRDTENALVRAALIRLLPRLKPSDVETGLLLPRHIECLNRSVDFCRAKFWGSADEVAYALAVFKALEQIGDETSIPSVEAVIESARNESVREAAQACLPFLYERGSGGRSTLLRPAADHAGEDLLHPYQVNEGTETEKLLHSSSAPSEVTD